MLVERKDVYADSKDKERFRMPLSWAARDTHETVSSCRVHSHSSIRPGRPTRSHGARRHGHEFRLVRVLKPVENRGGENRIMMADRTENSVRKPRVRQYSYGSKRID